MRGIVDAIYWRLHSSFLRNERKKADLLLGMLEDEGKRTSLKDELGPIHHARFEMIQENIRNGRYGRLHGMGFESPVLDPFVNKERTIQEADFHKKLMTKEGRQRLFDCAGIEFWATMVHEYEMDPYGRCDFLIREGRIWHVCEVKAGMAKHDILGQMDKYITGISLDMCMGTHDHVNGIVLSKEYSAYVSRELSRMGITLLSHDGTVESINKPLIS